MILLDTSIWIDHLRKQEDLVKFLLKRRQIVIHPFVLGEIAVGLMANYDLVLQSLTELPQAVSASHGEVLLLIKQHSLMGSGIGYIDAHLLASVKLMSGTRLLTRDKRLARIAALLDVGYEPQPES